MTAIFRRLLITSPQKRIRILADGESRDAAQSRKLSGRQGGPLQATLAKAKVEEKWFPRLGRHVDAYDVHITESMRHFQQACNAMIDGALCGDLGMVDDEFPKLAELALEVQRTYKIWSTIQGLPLSRPGSAGIYRFLRL